MEIVLFTLAVVGFGLLVGVASGNQTEIAETFGDNIEEALFADIQESTTALRVELWQESWTRVAARPAFADGVGAVVTLNRPWPATPELVEAHSIYIDVALRLGLIGLFFFLVAIFSTVGAVVATWRHHYDDLVATFVLGIGVALAGLAIKGSAESILEKYRLVVIAGLFIGMALAGARDVSDHDQSSADNQSEKSMPATVRSSLISPR